jgi:hypothetical protein
MVVPRKGSAGPSRLIPTRPRYVDFRLSLRDATIEEAPQPEWREERAPPPHKADFPHFAIVCRIPAPHAQIQWSTSLRRRRIKVAVVVMPTRVANPEPLPS